MGKKKATERVQKLLDMAVRLAKYSGGAVPEVARRLGVSEKELIRLAETLSMCGLPPYTPDVMFDVYIDENNRIHISGPGVVFERPVQLSRTEGLSLLLAGRAAGGRDAALESALDKVRGAMGPEKLTEVERLSARVDVSPETGNLKPLLETLSAAAGREKVVIEYYTPARAKVSSRTLSPYGLIYNVDCWYVVGWCEMRGGQRVFRVDRIKSVKRTGEKFRMPGDFDLEAFRRNELFKYIERPHAVRIRFGAALAGWASDRWPGRAELNADGSATVEFRLDRLESYVGFVLGFGADAVVESPPALRDMVAAAASAALDIYL